MSKLKHTPGPWEREGTFIYSLQDCEWLGNPSKENRFDLNVQGFKCPSEEKEANARLIAAAPEMLEALIHQYGWVKGLYNLYKIDENKHPDSDLVRTEKSLREIIERATGLKIEEVL